MTDDQLRAFVPDLIRWEGSTGWMYRDVLGFPTVGIGFLIHDVDHVCTFPFWTLGRPSTRTEVVADFHRIMAMAKGLPAARYRAATEPRIELRDQDVADMAVDRLRREFLPGLVRLLPDFDEYPVPAQSALVDMVFNLGSRGLSQFGNMLAACRGRHWAAAANSCHVKTSRDDRNEWRKEKFMEATQS